MTPAAARLARLAVEASVTEPPEQAAALLEEFAAEEEPPLVRKVVATIHPVEPTVFVARGWNDAAKAVIRPYGPPTAPASRPTAPSDPGRTAALIGAVLGFVLLLFMMRHRRQPADI